MSEIHLALAWAAGLITMTLTVEHKGLWLFLLLVFVLVAWWADRDGGMRHI